jgi:hypothetical protein
MTDRIGEDPIRRSRQRQWFQEEPNSWYAHLEVDEDDDTDQEHEP